MKQIGRLVAAALLPIVWTTAGAIEPPTVLSAQGLNSLGAENGAINSTRVGGIDVRNPDSVENRLPVKIEHFGSRFERDRAPASPSARGHWPHPFCWIVDCPPPPWCIYCPWPPSDPCCLPYGISAKSCETAAQMVPTAIPDKSKIEVTPNVPVSGTRSAPAVAFRDAISEILELQPEQPDR